MADTIPEHNADYADTSYWNTRFSQEQQYDWLKGYSHFRHLCAPHMQPSDKILVLGCGNSSLTQDLYEDGFHHLTSIDLSDVVIEHMQAKALQAGQTEICWQVADMLALPFANGQFDVIIEKATMDVLFVKNDSPFDPKEEVKLRVYKLLEETYRVLRSKGSFISISFAQPHFRKPFLLSEQFSWSVDISTIGDSFHYYVYVMHKGCRKDTDMPVPFGWPSRDNPPTGFADNSMTHDHMDNENYLLGVIVADEEL